MDVNRVLKGKKGIYLLVIGPHIYVGSSKNLFIRLSKHKNTLKSGKHENTYMQRSWNKYSNHFIYRILEFCDESITQKDLLKREKYYIDLLHPDLNFKLDPTTEERCLTTIKPIYQFDLFGNFIKKWDSLTDAADYYKINISNIIHVCSGDQRHTHNFLWSYSENLEIPPIGIYVYSLQGNLLGKYNNTVEVYESLFTDKSRKTVLSQLKNKINSNIPYCNVFLSTDKNFRIPDKNYDYKDNSELELFLRKDPFICVYNEYGIMKYTKKLSEFAGSSRVRNYIRNNVSKCVFTENMVSYRLSGKFKKVYATNIDTQEVSEFNSLIELIDNLFDGNMELKNTIIHHMSRKTPYQGYLISR